MLLLQLDLLTQWLHGLWHGLLVACITLKGLAQRLGRAEGAHLQYALPPSLALCTWLYTSGKNFCRKGCMEVTPPVMPLSNLRMGKHTLFICSRCKGVSAWGLS